MPAPSQISVPWSTQPQGFVSIDWENPITTGLLSADVPGYEVYFIIGSPQIISTVQGRAFVGNGTSSVFYKNLNTTIDSTQPTTVMALVMGVPATDRRVYGVADPSSYVMHIGSSTTDASKLRVWFRSPGIDIGGPDATATVFEAGIPHIAVLRYQNGVLSSFVDGVANSSVTTNASGTSSPVQLGIGGLVRSSVGSAFATTSVICGAFWKRGLSDSEIASISANPWQLFEPQQTTVPAPYVAAAPLGESRRREVEVQRTTQPQEKTSINWNNTLSQSLVFHVNFAEDSRDKVGPAGTVTDIGTIGKVLDSGRYGTTTGISGTNAIRSLSNPGDALRINAGAVTHAGLIRLTSIDSNFGGIFAVSDASGNASFSLQRNSTTNDLYFFRGNSSGQLFSTGAPVTLLADGQPHLFICVSEDIGTGSAGTLWIDGIKYTGTSPAGAGTQAGAGALIRFFSARDNSVSFGSDGNYYAHWTWKRALTDTEALEFTANPWQLYEPEAVVLPKPYVPALPLGEARRRETPVERTTQPQDWVKVDSNHPLAANLHAVAYPVSPKSFLEGVSQVQQTQTYWTSLSTLYGRSLAFNGTSSVVNFPFNRIAINTSQDVMVVVEVYRNSSTNSNVAQVVSSSAVSVSVVYTGGVWAARAFPQGGATYTADSTDSRVFGRFAAVYSPATGTLSLYADGEKIAESSNAPAVLQAPLSNLRFNAENNFFVSGVFGLSGKFTPDWLNVARSPWQLLEPETVVLPKPYVPALPLGESRRRDFSTVRDTQPQGVTGIDWTNPIAAGIERAIIHNRYRVADVAKNAALTFGTNSTVPASVTTTAGIGILDIAGTNCQINIPRWTNTGSASVLLVQSRTSGVDNNWHTFGTSGLQSHFPFSNLYYTDAFQAFRWNNGSFVAAGKDPTKLHTILITVTNGRQRIYWDGVLWYSQNNPFDAVLPETLVINPGAFRGTMVASVFWSRELSAEEASIVGQDPNKSPWQLFESEAVVLPKPYVPLPAFGEKRRREEIIRTTQPQEHAQINWSNPLTGGLVHALDIASGGRDVVNPSQNITTLESNSYIGSSVYGKALIGRGALVQGLRIVKAGFATSPFSDFIPDGSPFTVAMGVIPFASGVRESMFSDFPSGGSSSSIAFEQTVSNQFFLYNGGGINTGTVVPGKLTHLCLVRDAVNVTGYVDAVAATPVAKGTPGVGYTLRLGAPGDLASGSLNFRGGIPYYFLWNRALTAAEVAEVARNPWSMFQSSALAIPAPYVPPPALGEARRRDFNTVRTIQPQGLVEIDQDNPITAGLVAVYNPGTGPFEIIRKIPVSSLYSSPLTDVTSIAGKARTGVPGVVQYDNFVLPFATGGSLTVLSVVLHNINRATNAWFVARNNTNTIANCHWALAASGSSIPAFTAFNTVNTGVSAVGHRATSAMQPEVLVGRVNDTIVDVFMGGVKGTSATITGISNVPVVANSTQDPLSIGHRFPNFASTSACGPVFLTLLWDRALTDTEVAEISANPWQIFEPEAQMLLPKPYVAPPPADASRLMRTVSVPFDSQPSIPAEVSTGSFNAVYWNGGTNLNHADMRTADLGIAAHRAVPAITPWGTGYKATGLTYENIITISGGRGLGATAGTNIFYAGMLLGTTSGTSRIRVFSKSSYFEWSAIRIGGFYLDVDISRQILFRFFTKTALVSYILGTVTIGEPFWVSIYLTATGFEYSSSVGSGSVIVDTAEQLGAAEVSQPARLGSDAIAAGHSNIVHIAAFLDTKRIDSLQDAWNSFNNTVTVPYYKITYTGIPVLSALDLLSATISSMRYRVQLTF